MNGDTIVWAPGVTLEEIERQVIMKAFAHYAQNKTATAQALGISIRTLDSRFEKYEADAASHAVSLGAARDEREAMLRRHRGNPPNQYDTAMGPAPLQGLPSSTSTAVALDLPVVASEGAPAASLPPPVSKSQPVPSVQPPRSTYPAPPGAKISTGKK